MQNFESSRGIFPFLRNFYILAEFCGIQYWPVIRRQIRHIFVGFVAVENYLLHIDMMCCQIHDCYSSSDGRNFENIDLI